MAEDTPQPWAALCPKCGAARFLWPVGQDVTTGREPHATWHHFDGIKECS